MIFAFGTYKLDVDVEQTKEYYKLATPIHEACSCSGCRNYAEALSFLPQEITSFFVQLGIEIAKPVEVYVYCANADNTLFYGGWYHICATMTHGESPVVSTGQNQGYFDETKTVPITDGFKVYVQKECALLDSKFPLPAVQLGIMADIPWVLAEKHEYPKDMSRRK